MQEAEEQDTCRICSAPAEPDQPLFHPCKCSGTIRYIHQDCLTTWLAHSKKKTCDVCKHSYSFTKVYAADMPTRLPPTLVARRLVQQAFNIVLVSLRALMVASVWLAVLPLATLWTWRLCFAFGEFTSYYIADRPIPVEGAESTQRSYHTILNDPTTYSSLSQHPLWLAISNDIFSGQIIASLIVVTFVAIFLLREWISQNARPGVLEGEDMPLVDLPEPGPQANLEPLELDDAPALPVMAVQDRIAMAERQLEAVRALDAMQANRGRPGTPIPEPAGPPQGRLKRDRTEELDVNIPFDTERERHRAQTRRVHTARRHRQQAISEGAASSSSGSVAPADWPQEFTFRSDRTFATQTGEPSTPAISGPRAIPPTMNSPFPPVALQQPVGAQLPFSFDQAASSSSAVNTPGTPLRRPPLPNTFLPPGSSGPSSPARVTPMISPGLATYRPPEVMVEDTSYFDDFQNPLRQMRAEVEPDEMGHYFIDPDEDEEGDVFGQEMHFHNHGDGEVPLEQQDDRIVRINGPPQEEPVVPNLADDAEMAANLNDDLDGGADEDMEGALEAIGMRGPLYGVIQNATLMVLVLDAAIVLGVMLPFTVGKMSLLLALDPHRFLQLLHLPIRAIRLVTDPVVDAAVAAISYILFGALSTFYVFILEVSPKHVGDRISKTVQYVMQAYPFSPSATSSATHTPAIPSPSSMPWDEKLEALLAKIEPTFAPLGKEVRLSAARGQEGWKAVALGTGAVERAVAVVFGYLVISLAMVAYVNLLSVGNQQAGKTMKSFLKQHLLVFKVAAFIFIELVLFPLGCGIILDACTLWFFTPHHLGGRTLFLFQAPMTATFYHWVAGTMFMYSFAILLSGCRSIMRPGAMWFVKDPQDQNSHPIRDILDRSSFTQLRKICVSAIMYTIIVAFTTASASVLLTLGTKSVLPFRWKSREPLMSIPIDLLFMQYALPHTIEYFRPRKAVRKVVMATWKYLAHQLRLSSYFFGVRVPDEEVTPRNWELNRLWKTNNMVTSQDKRDGSFRRVPANDNIVLAREYAATAEVTEMGIPATPQAVKLIAIQNHEARRARRDYKKDYMTVYLPPAFKYRMLTFVLILWGLGAMCCGAAVAAPVLLGRAFFKLFIESDVHDGYSFLAGFYMLWACHAVGQAVGKLDRRRQRLEEGGPRPNLAWLTLKRGLIWCAKAAYVTFFCGGVIPALLGIMINLYVTLPLRLMVDPTVQPRMKLADEWALGLLYMKIFLHVRRGHDLIHFGRGLERMARNGWTNLDPWRATKDVIAPVVAGLTAMIVLPALGFLGLKRLFAEGTFTEDFLFINVYPTIFIAAAMSRSALVSVDVVQSWSQSIRDKEFLVEMRLRNHENEQAGEARRAQATQTQAQAQAEQGQNGQPILI
ncbi:hypothetical protein CYLTODRAFT_492008 [Cylindrobasidium torrendii FP15055 ss-10]|uniref:RING-type E3 ubiquitin transferase n=1 Tax=Cylindrobasidium torrendii FP15055 ss-10 TaxID=1314674 RepID=A0A0D7B5I0_9AGAR|nr:hypothetical protein CYLTODRAFT_492008 [Cylindrobasidium torrendii FP15055 ss-10]